jgi:hypothetical protein
MRWACVARAISCPAEISGGMNRRVALARAIALDPELVMYDEPFSGLDPISLGTAARLIRDLNEALGLTSIVVSHDLPETFRIADQVIILANGRVAAQGTPDEVRQSDRPAGAFSSSAVRATGRCVSTTRAHRLIRTSAGYGHELAPGRLGFATRRLLAEWGYGARLLLRLLALAPRHWHASAWCATNCSFWAIIRWRSSQCPAFS